MIDFSMTKEQEAMRKSVREFCRKEVVPVAAEMDQIADPDELIPKVLQIMKKGKDLELSCMVIPEQYGGLGLDNVTNEHYADHLGGINRVAGSDVAVGERIPGAGRFVYAMTSYQF